MAKKALIYLIYDDLAGAVKGLAKRVSLGRPQTETGDLTDLIAIELPTSLYPQMKGKLDTMAKCYGLFTIFCKAKSDGTLNIGHHSEVVQKVQDVFPINGRHISAVNPTILMDGNDGNGYQVTKISFQIRTKFNARDIQDSNNS